MWQHSVESLNSAGKNRGATPRTIRERTERRLQLKSAGVDASVCLSGVRRILKCNAF